MFLFLSIYFFLLDKFILVLFNSAGQIKPWLIIEPGQEVFFFLDNFILILFNSVGQVKFELIKLTRLNHDNSHII
jgi:hypothetical protein